jgi:hypothetical protein
MRVSRGVGSFLKFNALLLVCGFFSLASLAQERALNPAEAGELADLMCRQLPNLTTFDENAIVVAAPVSRASPVIQLPLNDDVFATLRMLGKYSLGCLTDRITDVRWMPDPRTEPLLGAPLVGDVAYMVLTSKGVPDLLPGLAHRDINTLRMDFWFHWPTLGNNRLKLQAAVRRWITLHPNCCGEIEPVTGGAVKFRMSGAELRAASVRVSRLRPGMNDKQVLGILGKPDAEDNKPTVMGDPSGPGLLTIGSRDRNEDVAWIYFFERWTDKVGLRDTLRDRYVILYFAENRFVNAFSNVEEIAPIFPRTKSEWERAMWGPPVKKEERH